MTRPRSLPAAVAGLVLGLVACTPAEGPVERLDLAFPSPLSGPGRPQLSAMDQETIELAWRLLAEGNASAAGSRAALAGESAPARLLALQATHVEAAPALEGLAALAAEHPEYAAAWLTLSVVAEANGDQKTALEAAARGADLWPSRTWQRRARSLHRTWVEARVDEGWRLLDAGEAEAALAMLEAAVELEPDNGLAQLARARALVTLDRLEEAARVLDPLTGDEAVFLRGDLAERSGDWQLALDLYEQLPPDHPGREPALKRARTRWRLSNLPAYVQEALASEHLDRGQMAVLLVSLVPQLRTLGQGGVPLLTDIVELPSHRELVAAVQAGLVTADLIEHRLYPDRPSDGDQVRTAVDRVCELVEVQAPLWCEAVDQNDLDCVSPESLLTGQALARLVLDVVHGEGE